MLSWARECVDYTEDTLSDKSNNVETCNPGCDQPTKYKCKDGYTYDETSKSCKPATCHIEEAPNPNPDNCKYDLRLKTYDAIPSGGVDTPAGTSVRVWAYRQDPYVISDIKGISGQFQVSSYSGYKDFTCESGETYRLYATCGEGCAEFPLTEKKDENCWDCYICPASNNRFQCTLSEKSGYKWDYSTSTCVKTTPSTVTFAFVRQDCPSPHKGENRVAWIENGQLKYKTIDGSGEVPYSDEYVVLANVYVDSSAQRGDSYQEPLVYELDAGVMCAETNGGASRPGCLSTQGTDLQYTQIFVGYPSGDHNIFPSLSTGSTMTPFKGGGYGMLLRLHGVEQKSSYTVRVSCESQCKASKNDDWHACYYGRRASGHYDCRSCR